MQINWPSPLEYNEAVQNPLVTFTDPDLQRGEPELNQLGLPKPATGNFATVYKMICSQGNWAVRCFLKSAYDQELRYSRIAQHLEKSKLSCAVGFEYQPEGMRFRGRHLPLLKMEWVDGITLDNFVHVAHGDKEIMLAVAEKFFQLYLGCQAGGIAHGDLQHGNLMVTNDSLYLVDYDGMYVPSLKGSSANELGHRNYQHPGRTSADFGPSLDNFSAWVVLVSLYALALDASLWQTLAGGEECLLFRQSDFRLPASSTAFSLLACHKNEKIREMSSLLVRFLGEPVEYIPPPTREAFPELTSELKANWAQLVASAKEQSFTAMRSTKSSANSKAKAGDSSVENSAMIAQIVAGMKNENPVFANGKFAEAAQYYEGLLSNQSTELDPKNHIETVMQLGYCQIYLGNMAKAELTFRNGLVAAKANNLFLLAMRCAVCMLVARFAQGNVQMEVGELLRYFPSQSDMTMALKAELAGPLAGNPWLANFVFQLAKQCAKAQMTITRQLYDTAIAAASIASGGKKSLLTALCLHGRVAYDLRNGVKAASEQDLTEAMDIVRDIKGSSSHYLEPMQLDLVRLLTKTAVLRMQPGDYSDAESTILRAFSEVDKLNAVSLPVTDYRDLVSKSLIVYSNTKSSALLTGIFEILAKAFREKPAMLGFLIERILDCLDFGHIDEAQILLTKAFEELSKLPPGAELTVHCAQLLSATQRFLINCEDRKLARIAFEVLKHQADMDEQALSELASHIAEPEEES